MTPAQCSVHTHADLCDGTNTLEEMAAAAYGAGVRYYGVSCHSHTPIPEDEGLVLPADLTQYKKAVLDLRSAYAGRMEVLLGLEWDSQSDTAPTGLDYWIGSVHSLCCGGKYYALDWSEERLAACRDEAFGGDALAMAEAYFREVCRVAALRPTILGHMDLITKLNGGGRFFDESHPRYRAAAREVLHQTDPQATLLEINTGGMARGYREVPYPALFLLKEWRALGGRIILTSDAHSADAILYGYEEAAALARAAGFESSVLLTADGPREVRL